MRYLITIACLLQVIFGYSQIDSTASVPWSEEQYDQRPRVGLALSGGAAHGLAHIGLLQYLEEVGIHIDYITGTSMGAIIGGLYAVGYDAERCREVAATIDWDDVLSTRIPSSSVAPVEKYKHDKYPVSIDLRGSKLIIPTGIISSSRLDLLLEQLFAGAYKPMSFDSLPTPFRCYAVDIVDGTVVEMSSGQLSRSLRASMAIPSVFSPVEIDGRKLVDGGLIRNLPVSHCKDMGADIVIGSYVGSDRGDAAELGSLLDILKQSAFMMSISDSEYQQSLADIMVVPKVKDQSAIDFNNYQYLIDQGYQSAKEHKEEFLRLQQLLHRYDRPTKNPSLDDPGFIFIDQVVVEAESRSVKELIHHKLNITNRSFATFQKITKGIESVYATKNFKKVDYQLNYKTEGADLIITAEEVEHSEIGANINHFSSTRSALLLSLQSRNLLGKLSNLDLTARVSENPGLFAQYYKRGRLLDDGLVYGLSTKLEKLDLPFGYKDVVAADTKLWEGEITPYLMWESSSNLSLKMYWKADFYNLSNTIRRLGELNDIVVDQYSIGLELRYDNLDRRHFPTQGTSAWLLGQYAYSQTYDIDWEGGGPPPAVPAPRPYLMPRAHVSTYQEVAAGWNLRATVDAAYKREGYLLDNIYIGGTDQERQDRLPFIGLREADLHMQTYGYGLLALRRQLTNITYLSFIGQGIIGNSPIISFTAPPDTEDVLSLWAVGVSFGLDLPVGPLHLDIGYSSHLGDMGVAFSLGYRHIY